MAQTISLTGVKANVKKHLSIIGKRLYDKEGKNLFSNITVSSAEDGIFDHYVSAAAQNIAGAIAQFVTSYSDTSITVNDARWDAPVSLALNNAAQSYALLFSVGEYLAMTHPELAEKYYRDAQGMMNTIITTAYHKEPPTT
jgi:5-hydroxyisourate hydrolase-like protein (transthyretin family)